MEAAHFLRVNFGGYVVDVETIGVTWLIIILSAIFFGLFSRRISLKPGPLQNFIETVVGFFDKLATDMMGPEGREYTPAAVFIFITVLSFNIFGLLPGELKIHGFAIFAPPTRDINTTLSLALVSFFLFNYYGFKKKGLGYIGHFIEPAPELARSLPPFLIWMLVPLTLLFVVLNTVELGARVLSLTVRLFCNIMGDHIIAGALIFFMLIVLKLFVAAGIVAYVLPLFVFFLGVMVAVVQAFIFAVLTLTYISGAVAHSH